MFFFFFLNWFPQIPTIFFKFSISTSFFFYKRLNLIKSWSFFFNKVSNVFRLSKIRSSLKKKKHVLLSLSSNFVYNIFTNFFKKISLRLKLKFSFFLKTLFFYNLFSIFYSFSFSLIKNFFFPENFFSFGLFFFFKATVSKLKKFFIWIFAKKFSRRRRRFRKKKVSKRRSLRTLFIKKDTKHRLYLKVKSKKQISMKSLFYFYTLLWKKLQNHILRKRKFKKFFMRKILKKHKKHNNLKFFVKKITQNFFKKSKYLLFFIKLNKRYNNYYFPDLINKKFSTKLFMTQKKRRYLHFVKFFSFFIIQFLENTLKTKFIISLRCFKNKKLSRPLKQQLKKIYYFQRKIGNGFFLREMLFIIWLSFKSKDLLFLVLWIKRTMERIKWRKQKLFLIALRVILRKSISPYFYYLRCYGYRCVIWGKIGVAGNAKTRNFVCKNKLHSLTSKMYKNTYEFTTINTHTGVLGLSFFLVY